jgi:hypothetical protein
MTMSSVRGLRRLTGLAVVLVVGAGALAACGDDGKPTVNVTLSEWIVQPDKTSVDSGEIEFVADNKGGETHELVVVRAASAESLPTDADGAVDEDKLPEGALIGEIEDVESQQSKSVTLDLSPGSYVLFCNVVETTDGETESHFAKGMHTSFEVK